VNKAEGCGVEAALSSIIDGCAASSTPLAGAGAATDSYFLGEAGPEQLNAGWIEISFGERVA